MNALNEEVVEVRINAPPDLLERLREAMASENEYQKEQDLLSYVLLLGLHIEEGERVRAELEAAGMGTEEIYQALYEELARVQGAYAAAHYAMAEAARDDQTGRMVNGALRREVSATKGYLLPRLEKERDQLLRRREALLCALGVDT